MRRFVLFSGAVAVGLAAGLALEGADGETQRALGDRSQGAIAVSRVDLGPAGTSLEAMERGLGVEPGTRREVGTFALRGGRSVRLHVAEMTGGGACLIEADDAGGASSSCLTGGLFGRRKAAFFVSSKGGPDRFTELYLRGVAAPSVSAVVVVKSDGATDRMELNSSRAFLFQASPEDLAADLLPSALSLLDRGGRLVETIDIPALR